MDARLLTVSGLSAYLSVSPSTVYRLMRSREIPYLKQPGLGIRFRQSDIEAWIERTQKKPHTSPPYFDSSVNLDLDLEGYDKLYLKGGRTMKSKGRWTYPFGSVYVRGTRSGKERFHIYYKTGSRQYVRESVKGATTRAEALKVLQQRAMEAFRESNGLKKPMRRIRFGELAEMYLANTKHLKDWRTNDYRMRLNLVPFFGKLLLEDITPQHIEQYRALRLKKIKPITTNRELALLKGMFTKAIDYGFATSNPVKRVKMIPETDSARERILTREEEARLMDVAIEHFKPFLTIALNSGMRRGEILNLRWAQVDFQGRLVHVIKTKRNKNRVVPMNESLFRALQGLRNEARGDDWVYPYRNVSGVFEAARKKAGLLGLRLHDLRHTFATRLIHAGVDVFTVQKILGHSTITMTMRYVHSFEPEMRAAVARLDEKFAQSLHNFPAAASGAPEGANVSHLGSVN